MTESYVHGYSAREARRLDDQAASVRELIHHDTQFPAGARVLEVACGIGAQTGAIAGRNPDTRFVSFDLALPSLRRAADRLRAGAPGNVQLLAADLFALPFPEASFDHLFISYVLEHLPDPADALVTLRPLLRQGGSITLVEGDHGSCYFSPTCREAERAWECLIRVQAELGGDALVGRRLFPLLRGAGFDAVEVSPRMVYADASHPERMDLFVARTIVPMVEGVEDQALGWGMITRAEWEVGLEHLRRLATAPEGTFCYTFFKATARLG